MTLKTLTPKPATALRPLVTERRRQQMNGDGEGLTAEAYYGDGPDDMEGLILAPKPATFPAW